MDSIHHWRCK